MIEQKVGETYVREWKKEGNIANLVIIHGIGEHSGRYQHVGDYFSEKGINVYTGDLTGHGKSEGIRVYVESAEDYLDNVRFFINRVEGDKPIFVLGHSMGGFIVLYYGIKDNDPRVKGIIVSSPYIKERLEIPKWKLIAGKTLGKLVPKLRMETGIRTDMQCRDKTVCKAFEVDELTCATATAGWFLQVEKARQELAQHSERFYYPIYILQAGDDLIVDPKATEAFFNSLKVSDKRFKMCEGCYHEILNDPGKEDAMESIYQWIKERI